MMRELVGVCRWACRICGFGAADPAAIAARRGRPVRAWQHHLGPIFGGEALGRVRASPRPRWPCPPPEVADGLVRTCRTAATSGCWSSSIPGAPRRIGRGSGPPLLHRLAMVKPQGSNTKLVGQLHPHHQAKGRNRWLLADREEAAAGHQIADGQNRGMMHQFSPAPSGSSTTARAPRRRCGTSPSTWSSWWPAAPSRASWR
jgi:hypothetical protein